MFEYFCCRFGGIVVPISLALARFTAGEDSYSSWNHRAPGGSPINPDSWESIRRIVTVSISPCGLRASRSSGRNATAGSSRWSIPSSRSCRIAVAVNVFVIDAIRNNVPGSCDRFDPTSA